MTRLKPDRFQQMVGTRRHIAREGRGDIILESTAVHLLRLYHRRVVRLVKGQPRHRQGSFIMVSGYGKDDAIWIDIHALLADLAHTKKGMP